MAAERRVDRRISGISAERIVERSVTSQPCTTCATPTTVVDVSSCALSDVNAYGCQRMEQGKSISEARTKRKPLAHSLTTAQSRPPIHYSLVRRALRILGGSSQARVGGIRCRAAYAWRGLAPELNLSPDIGSEGRRDFSSAPAVLAGLYAETASIRRSAVSTTRFCPRRDRENPWRIRGRWPQKR
jgi:hypothetical protein